jgi:hypothetical protein
MSSQSTHPDTRPVVCNVRSLANQQNQQKCGATGNSQLPPPIRPITVPAGNRDCPSGQISVPSTIQGQNSAPSSALNNFRVADISQPSTTTPSPTQRWSIISLTATPGTSSRNTTAPSGGIHTDSMCHVESSPASGIASTPTPPCGHPNLPTPIRNAEAQAIIAHPLQSRATEKKHRRRQRQFPLQAVCKPRFIVSGSRSFHRFGHSERTCLVFVKSRLLGLYIWNRRPFLSSSELQMVGYATRCVAEALAEAPYC